MSRWAGPLAVVAGVCCISCLKVDSPRSAREAAAIISIRTVHTAQVQYSSQFGRFATSLAELGSVSLIGADLAAGEKNGYRFTLKPTPAGYEITAVPETFGVTGARTFFSDQSMVIRVNEGPEPATANSKELSSTSL